MTATAMTVLVCLRIREAPGKSGLGKVRVVGFSLITRQRRQQNDGHLSGLSAKKVSQARTLSRNLWAGRYLEQGVREMSPQNRFQRKSPTHIRGYSYGNSLSDFARLVVLIRTD
jgi:negative regulator of sigma E activity